ncbi:hypothetical protein L541_2270 [Bordetella hinzii CA90 BAL1384]|nr:hypothetical protein L541_2270 [Bordetella hinzii CA90 BAL1384]KCB48332.1 hypothetical protein L538_2200 [Bordetella hinzii 4161]KCB51049.1 hypothetical protein L537_2327 [Bordetella hinzii 1277]
MTHARFSEKTHALQVWGCPAPAAAENPGRVRAGHARGQPETT